MDASADEYDLQEVGTRWPAEWYWRQLRDKLRAEALRIALPPEEYLDRLQQAANIVSAIKDVFTPALKSRGRMLQELGYPTRESTELWEVIEPKFLMQYATDVRIVNIDSGRLNLFIDEYLRRSWMHTDYLNWVLLNAMVFDEAVRYWQDATSSKGGGSCTALPIFVRRHWFTLTNGVLLFDILSNALGLRPLRRARTMRALIDCYAACCGGQIAKSFVRHVLTSHREKGVWFRPAVYALLDAMCADGTSILFPFAPSYWPAEKPSSS
jgi:hypothetical protein